ncbi:UDP-2,4-diacetamido-2,4,6-trideoxy-beta-L-altropyranose hydrolase [Marinobacter segnicrescens]|uniref:UDP-2,4-diacetamido-2,4, 6-trideoxy-beta-L-altropyranose hydrolase n=1 Tax=Marinobacter segnicrescens TaxID=430453 RepID=UPI003A8E6EBD
MIFRADASVQIGTGHVMRCLTLAEDLRRQGHQCVFICRDHVGHLADLVTKKAFDLHLLRSPEQSEMLAKDEPAPPHSHWLGVPWQTDAKQTLEALSGRNADWLIVDHYALDAKWERQLAEAVGQIMVIDDLADREHYCAVLLDQNVLDGDARQRYEAKVNKECDLLLGPHYALLRPEYELLTKALPERDGNISRVLVFVGGSDPYHLTECYLEALQSKSFKHLFVDVVIGRNHPSPEVVKQLVMSRSNTQLHCGLPSLSAMMVRADLMLGAGGATNWERMCVGLNGVVASVASNQDEINRVLEAQNLIQFLGDAETLSIGEVNEAIKFALECPEYIRSQSNAMRAIVDGCGTQHISQALKDIRDRAAP